VAAFAFAEGRPQKLVEGPFGAKINAMADTPSSPRLFDDELHEAMQQLFDETIEAIQLAKVSPDLNDLAATFAVALLKLGLATGFVEQRHPGFARDIEEKRQRVIAALTQEQQPVREQKH
jgi:hypothetical protein